MSSDVVAEAGAAVSAGDSEGHRNDLVVAGPLEWRVTL